jgi:lipopolysaccharide heptosyltransferase II
LKIAIFRALYLGDMLLCVPALRALRRRFPHAEITLIGLPWADTFARRFTPYIDRFVEFCGYPGLKELPVAQVKLRQFLAEQRAYGYDLVIQMHGSGQVSNHFALALHGRKTTGYYDGILPKGMTCGLPYPDDESEVQRNLGLARLLGCEHLDPVLEFPLFQEDRAEAARLLFQLPRADRPWIGIHSGSRSPSRRWPAAHFAQLADALAKRFHAQIILTGSNHERSTVRDIAARMQTMPLDLAGQTSLGGLAALIGELDLFISNDSGPAHVANAIDTPSVTIFGPADPARWAALDQTKHPIVRHSTACSPCPYWECPIDHRCLRRIKPETVLEVAAQLLAKGNRVCRA